MSAALAQICVARLRAGLDAPVREELWERLAAIDEVAEGSDGFLWQFTCEQPGDAIVDVFGDARLVVRMSLWSSLEAFRDFVHATAHAWILARRPDWLEDLPPPHAALWWREPFPPPTLAEGRARLALLGALGPTAEAFTFASPFAAEEASSQVRQDFATAATIYERGPAHAPVPSQTSVLSQSCRSWASPRS